MLAKPRATEILGRVLPEQWKEEPILLQEVESVHFDEVRVIVPEVFEDERGSFMEVFRADHAKAVGLPGAFVQENQSRSTKDVLRGLHFQWEPPMGKLMRVTFGTAFLVAVDLRKGSPTLGRWVGIEASEENRKQMWAPAGFARGFCVLSDLGEIQYLCTSVYNPKGESGILWNDPDLGIEWPLRTPILSKKDREAQTLAAWLEQPESNHFRY